jgi:MmyB-like transcription regulator ligand binding domain
VAHRKVSWRQSRAHSSSTRPSARTSSLGYALYAHLVPGQSSNIARFVFLDPRSHDFYIDWDQVADEVVAILRSEAGRDPYDKNLTDLVGELSTQSQEFRTKWAAHNVRFHDTGAKRLHHPVVGDLELTYEAFGLSGDSELTMFAYTAEPGSKSEEALRLLGSWAATPVEARLARRPESGSLPSST